jgi:hypothetical protein
MRNPLEVFFSVGDKVTKGDMKRKQDFDYYMFWIIFLAFFSIFLTNVYRAVTGEIIAIFWALVMFGICWFQYNNLKNLWQARKIMKEMGSEVHQKIEEEKIENISEMKKGFE